MVVIADGETHSTSAPVAAGTSSQYPVNGTVATGSPSGPLRHLLPRLNELLNIRCPWWLLSVGFAHGPRRIVEVAKGRDTHLRQPLAQLVELSSVEWSVPIERQHVRFGSRISCSPYVRHRVSRLMHHFPRLDILPEAHEPGVSQVAVRRPFNKLELSHQHRLNPPTSCHLLGGESLAPASAL